MLKFREYFLETITQNTENILRKVNTSYQQTKKGLPQNELEELIKMLQTEPNLINTQTAKQRLDDKLQIKPKQGVKTHIITQANKLNIPQEYINKFNEKQINQAELLTIAYFLKEGINKDLVEEIIEDIKKYNIKLSFQKVPIIDNYSFTNFTEFSTKVHEIKSEVEYKKHLQNLTLTKNIKDNPIAVSSDNTIKIYLGDTHKKCILHGKGTSFCISSKSSPQWFYTYRFNHQQMQYFIVDENQQPPIDLVNAGVAPEGEPFNLETEAEYSEWVDRRNKPNDIKGFNSVDEYKTYLSKKFGKNIDLILKPVPLSDDEKYFKNVIDKIRYGNSLPEELFVNPEKLALLLHFGYNIREEDFNRLPNSYKDLYILNLNKVKNKFEIKWLSSNLNLFNKWLLEQDDIDENEFDEFIKFGNIEIIRLLLPKVTDVVDAMMVAVKLNNKEIVELLLPRAIDINDEIYYAARHGYKGIVELLLLKATNVNDAIERAIKNGYIEIVELLLPKATNVDELIEISVLKGNEKIVELLLPRVVNGDRAIEIASQRNNVKIVELLLSKATYVDIAIGSAAYKGYKDIVELLLPKAVNVDRAINNAVFKGNEEMIKLLLPKATNVDIATSEAIVRDYKEIVKLLQDFKEKHLTKR